MYLVCKYIHERTDVRVLLTGEISDELFGYKYTDFAPSPEEFQRESKKRIDEIHMYDVLRADRCISANSLEARVPFGDIFFVRYVMGLDPALKMNRHGIGKYLLRRAFERDGWLPHDLLWRQKAAFSDAVGHSMADGLKRYAEAKYGGAEFEALSRKYDYAAPLHEGEPPLPGDFREILPRPGAHDPRLLDAEPRLARLRRERPERPRSLQLRLQRGLMEYIRTRQRAAHQGGPLFLPLYLIQSRWSGYPARAPASWAGSASGRRRCSWP